MHHTKKSYRNPPLQCINTIKNKKQIHQNIFQTLSSPSLGDVSRHELYKELLEESFKRKQQLEITGVQKNIKETWA